MSQEEYNSNEACSTIEYEEEEEENDTDSEVSDNFEEEDIPVELPVIKKSSCKTFGNQGIFGNQGTFDDEDNSANQRPFVRTSTYVPSKTSGERIVMGEQTTVNYGETPIPRPIVKAPAADDGSSFSNKNITSIALFKATKTGDTYTSTMTIPMLQQMEDGMISVLKTKKGAKSLKKADLLAHLINERNAKLSLV
jgi:hypothetical protein